MPWAGAALHHTRPRLAPFGGRSLLGSAVGAFHSQVQPASPGQARAAGAPFPYTRLQSSADFLIFNLSPFSLITSTTSLPATSPPLHCTRPLQPACSTTESHQDTAAALLPARSPPRTAAFPDLQ